MAITYNAGTNTITVVGTPYTFTDIYNADVAGGWGKVHLQGTSQFSFDAKLYVGDGVNTTLLADTNKQIVITDGWLTSLTVWCEVTTAATLQLGTLTDATDRVTSGGCCVVDLEQHHLRDFRSTSKAGVMLFYGSLFTTPYTTIKQLRDFQDAGCQIYNCVFSGFFIEQCVFDGYNVSVSKIQDYAAYMGSGITGSFLYAGNSKYYYQLLGGTNRTVYNLTGNNRTSKAFYVYVGTNGNLYLVNAILDAWDFNWEVANAKVYRQYTFDLLVTDKDGVAIEDATVTLKDKFDTVLFTGNTAVDGTIPQQIVSRGYYAQATGDTLYEYSPHNLTITMAGYQTYDQDLTFDRRTDLVLALLDEVVIPPIAVGGVATIGKPPQDKKILRLLRDYLKAELHEG